MTFLEELEDYEGLTSYEEGKLPEKLRQYLLYYANVRSIDPMDDAGLVERFVRDEWLGRWGVAVINGHEHAIFESFYYGRETHSKVIGFTIGAECGFLIVIVPPVGMGQAVGVTGVVAA